MDKNGILKKADYIVFAALGLLFFVFTATGLFTKLDFRLYDFLLGCVKEPARAENIVHINIDDDSIAEFGEWPWSRNIIADNLIRLKELGAERVVFDVEYLSPSALGVPSDSLQNIGDAFAVQEAELQGLIEEFAGSIEKGYILPKEVPAFKEELITGYVYPSIDSCKNTVFENVSTDNDEYFGKALQFFGNAWLTVNTRDVKIKTSPEDIAYVDSRFLFKNVSDPKNYIKANNVFTSNEQYNGDESGFSPALHTLLKRAKGVGFTNVIIDSDGSRRRVELLFNHNGNYLGQLVFAPLMDYLNVESFVRERNKLILHNAFYPGASAPEDVVIPLDEHGRMLINWLHCPFGESFRHESMSFFKQLDVLEDDIETNLRNFLLLELRDSGGYPLPYYSAARELVEMYQNICEERKNLLDLCKGYDSDGVLLGGISEEQYESYFTMRSEYFDYVAEFSATDFISDVEERLDELQSYFSEEQREEFLSLFTEEMKKIAANISTYQTYMSDMKENCAGAICIIGNVASSTTDNGATPFVRIYPNVGTHANVLNTILQKDFITPVAWYYGYAAAILLIGVILLIVHRTGNKCQNIVNGVFGGIVILVPVVLMTGFKIYIPFVGLALFVLVNYLGGVVIRFFNSSKEKEFIRQTFSQFVAKEVVDEIIKDPEKANLGGRNEHITALFSDIKSFSSFSELVTPEQLVNILNEYLGALSDNILEHSGTIDKYIGDSIVSLFGAPIRIENHAYAACAAAIRMKQTEGEFNRKHMLTGDVPRELYTRIGINTGDMIVGNMGTSLKKNYTMMGDNVNLASRLEGVNKVYGTWILCSEQTWKEADYGEHKGEIVVRKLDRVRVVGKTVPVQLYNVIGFRSEVSSNHLEEIELFHEALDLYLNRKFSEAGKMFVQANAMLPEDQTALVFADRCKSYMQKGVPEDWDGIMNLTSK